MGRVMPVALALAALSCGDGQSFDTFVIRARAPSGMEGAGPAIVPGAVDRVDLVIDPADNVRFDAVNYPPFADGDVIVRISAAGEYVISLGQGWLDRNRVTTETSWFVDVPLYVDGTQEVPVSMPALRVLFVQFGGAIGEQVIGEVTRGLTWPPTPGSETAVQLLCRAGYETECTTPTP